MIRFGLCCVWDSGTPHTRSTTIAAQLRIASLAERRARLMRLVHYNMSVYLPQSILRAAYLGIHCFRISAGIFPCMTHHEHGFRFEELPTNTLKWMQYCRYLSHLHRVRLTYHQPHFIVPGSADEGIAQRSLYEIVEVAKFCSIVGCDTMIMHCAGTGEKPDILARMVQRISSLSPEIRSYIGLENDHSKFGPTDVYPVCKAAGVRFVYDIHHHRLVGDPVSVADATEMALDASGAQEPLFHLSSPRNGWSGPKPFAHSDIIDLSDFPAEWMRFHRDPDHHITCEVETKQRETALANIITHFNTLPI